MVPTKFEVEVLNKQPLEEIWDISSFEIAFPQIRLEREKLSDNINRVTSLRFKMRHSHFQFQTKIKKPFKGTLNTPMVNKYIKITLIHMMRSIIATNVVEKRVTKMLLIDAQMVFILMKRLKIQIKVRLLAQHQENTPCSNHTTKAHKIKLSLTLN